MNIIDNDLLSIQEARIIAENAAEAKQKLSSFSQQKLDEIVESMTISINEHIRELAVMSCEETDYGRWQDKYIKNKFVCDYLSEKLRGMQCVGIISEDRKKKIMDVGVPMGVIVALPPATSPVSTTIYVAMIAIKSGNAILFSPHPRAKDVIQKTLDILISAAEECGLPTGALNYLHTVAAGGTIELMNHSATSLIMNTGVPGMLEPAYGSGKPVIYGGAGNGPAFIERTADIKQAVSDIILSKTFDYSVVSAAEQSIVVDRLVAAQVRQELVRSGAYFMSKNEEDQLSSKIFNQDGSYNSGMVGISALQLAKRAGFSVPDDTKVLISEQEYVSETNPYAKELLCPVLAYYVEGDWMNACEKCIELLLSEKRSHTLVIHARDEDVIRQFALKKPVGRMLVNTPAVFGSMGATTNLFPAMTLGSGSVGEGITSDNVSPMNLIYIRKVGYGVRQLETKLEKLKPTKSANNDLNKLQLDSDKVKVLYQVLKKALQED